MIEKLIGSYLNKMNPAEKEKIVENLTQKFFSDIAEDKKQRMIENIVSKAMENINISEIIPKMIHIMYHNLGKEKNSIEYYEKMDDTLRELVKVNKQILNELKKN